MPYHYSVYYMVIVLLALQVAGQTIVSAVEATPEQAPIPIEVCNLLLSP